MVLRLAEIPDGIFVTYSSSNDTLAPLILDAFDQTAGSCTSYIGLSSGNHYAITDWNPDYAPYRVSFNFVTHRQSLAACLVVCCGMPAGSCLQITCLLLCMSLHWAACGPISQALQGVTY